MNPNKLTYIDLFAGCGGLSDGFEDVGKYRLTAAVEWEHYPCATLAKRLKLKWGYNNADQRVFRFDIQRTEELLNGWNNDPVFGTHIGLKELLPSDGKIDLIIGGPPCQAYSLAGRIRDDNGMHNDYRNYLFESYLRVVRSTQPKVIVFENVEGMLSAQPGGVSIIDRIKQGFSDHGYELINDIRNNALIDCSEYGVPQIRKRVILLGISKDYFSGDRQAMLTDFYKKILPSFSLTDKKTVKDAIADLPVFKVCTPNQKKLGKKFSHSPFETNILNHIPRYHNERDIQIFKDLAHDLFAGNGKYSSIESLKDLYKLRTGKSSNIHKYYVLRWNKQSNAIVAHLYKDGLRHIHPDYKQARSITVREAARLQTFSDDFEFLGGMGDQYKMIGNAVPPRFAKALASAVLKFINKHQTKEEKDGKTINFSAKA